MSSISINSNIPALNAQRRLLESTNGLSQSFARLSSGLRINRASDDAAGLSISESLKSDARVLTRGVQNLNDGIGLLNIAEGALRELSAILIRQRELAQQSANGTLSRVQRVALNEEAKELGKEFNRIVETTTINKLNLLNLSNDSFRIQAGYGLEGSILLELGQNLASNFGTGTFSNQSTLGNGSTSFVLVSDLNGDGFADIIESVGANTLITFGDAEGSLSNTITLNGFSAGVVGDFNNDGIPDLMSRTFEVYLGDGNGGFTSAGPASPVGNPTHFQLADLNNNGNLDVVYLNEGTNELHVRLGDGNSGFSDPTIYHLNQRGQSISLGDFTGDGVLDLAATVNFGGVHELVLFQGNGDGGFQHLSTESYASFVQSVVLTDLNANGLTDMLISSTAAGGIQVRYANGDGTFSDASSQVVGASGDFDIGDFNGDGLIDIIRPGYNNFIIHFANEDGSYQSGVSTTTIIDRDGLAFGDINGDGALDVVQGTNGMTPNSRLSFQDTNKSTSIAQINITTKAGAREAMGVIDANLKRVSAELGSIGAAQSRLSSALANLQISAENFVAANSRIVDADMAQEAGLLVKNQILQQAGTSVLAQANTSPELALKLLAF